MHPWKKLGELRLDEQAYHNRSQIAALLVVAVGAIAAMLALTVLGWRWPHGWFPPVTISDEAEGFLGVGTLALAYAALVQAMSGLEAIRLRYRPSLALAATALPPTPGFAKMEPGDVGAFLGVHNLGPGLAKNVSLTWFSYPDSPTSRKYFRELVPAIPATACGGTRRPFLGVDSDEWWAIIIPEPFPTEMDFIVELTSQNVFENNPVIQRYRLRRSSEPGPVAGQSVWVWRILSPPPGRPDVLPSVQACLDLVKRQAPPYFWNLSDDASEPAWELGATKPTWKSFLRKIFKRDATLGKVSSSGEASSSNAASGAENKLHNAPGNSSGMPPTKFDILSKAYDEVNALTKHEDQKAERAVTAMAFVTLSAATIFGSTIIAHTSLAANYLEAAYVLMAAFVALSLLGTLLILYGIYPRFMLPPDWKDPSKARTGNPRSIFFALEIRKHDEKDWVRFWREVKDADLESLAIEQLSRETHLIARKIVEDKIPPVRWAFYCYLASLVPLIAMIWMMILSVYY
jgi:hypothetical protein